MTSSGGSTSTPREMQSGVFCIGDRGLERGGRLERLPSVKQHQGHKHEATPRTAAGADVGPAAVSGRKKLRASSDDRKRDVAWGCRRRESSAHSHPYGRVAILLGAGLSLALIAAGCGSTSTSSVPPAASSTTMSTLPSNADSSIHPLFLAPGVGVVAKDPNIGCSTVWLTADFVHWRNIGPPNPVLTGLPAGAPVQCIYIWTSASFVSADDGWVLGRDGDSTDTVLFHTLNGGRSWTKEPGGHTGSNGGSEVIGFADPSFGWRQQFATGANGPFGLELTNNGGTTWSAAPSVATHNGDQNLPVVFASPTVAFAAKPLSYVYARFPDDSPAPWIWRTTDGGNHWSHFTVPPPPTLAGATAFYGQPRFFGHAGVLPVAFTDRSVTWVAFYRSSDSGITWQLQARLRTHGDLLALPDGASTAPTYVAGAFPVVAVASPSTFWVIGTSTTGARTVSVTNDGGATWKSDIAAGIPTYKPSVQEYASQEGSVSLLQAASPNRAWIQVIEGSSIDSQSVVLLRTEDGGRNWTPLQPSP